MPNTRSAKKAVRSSNRKRQHNMFWKEQIKTAVKSIQKHLSSGTVNADIIKQQESVLFKVVDKAAKNKAIHKNKASRIKSRVSQKVSAHAAKSNTKSNSAKDSKPKAAAKSSKKQAE